MRTILIALLLVCQIVTAQDSTTTAYLENLDELSKILEKPKEQQRIVPQKIKKNTIIIKKTQDTLTNKPKEINKKTEHKKRKENDTLLIVIALIMITIPPIRIIYRIIKNQKEI